jgi:uncharacterized protein (TIGR02597 family)
LLQKDAKQKFPLDFERNPLHAVSRRRKRKKMKKTNLFAVLALAAAPALLHAQTTNYSDVVGYVSTTLASRSDTIISPQVLRTTELTAPVSNVSSAADQAVLTLDGVSLTADQFKYASGTQPKTYFVLVTAGNLTGTYFLVASNTSNQITVNLDGLTAGAADITSIEVRPCWTLNTLFPASDANVSFIPSASNTPPNRRTQLLLPNFTANGINRAAASTYFFNNTTGVQDWVTTASTSAKAGDTAIAPGQYIIHRNTSGAATPPPNLTFTHSGGVLARPLSQYIGTLTTARTDTILSLPRPTDYRLSELGFDTNSFVSSANATPPQRRDELLVIAPTGSGINRAASATYFRVGTNWYSTAASTTITNNAVVPAGAALIIRKYQSNGQDRVLTNNLNASL